MTELKQQRGEMLVAIMNNPVDFAIARDQHWYRIPISSVNKWLKNRWPPRWLAFYQNEAYAINYYAKVVDIQLAERWQLFPNELPNKKSISIVYRNVRTIAEAYSQSPFAANYFYSDNMGKIHPCY